MVCVTLQNTCHNLIKYASQIKDIDDKLFVLHVAKNGQSFMNAADEATTLEFLYTVSHQANADMTVLHSDNVVNAIYTFIKDNNIHTVILGTPNINSKDDSLITQLQSKLNDSANIILLDKKGEIFQ